MKPPKLKKPRKELNANENPDRTIQPLSGRAATVQHSQAKTVLEKEEATPAVPTFVLETKVGHVTTLVALGGGEPSVSRGAAPRKNSLFLCLPLRRFPSSFQNFFLFFQRTRATWRRMASWGSVPIGDGKPCTNKAAAAMVQSGRMWKDKYAYYTHAYTLPP